MAVQIEVVRNPKHPTMPDWLKDGDWLVIVIQPGEDVIALCDFATRRDAMARASTEKRQNKRLGEVMYAGGFWHQRPDGTWTNS